MQKRNLRRRIVHAPAEEEISVNIRTLGGAECTLVTCARAMPPSTSSTRTSCGASAAFPPTGLLPLGCRKCFV